MIKWRELLGWGLALVGLAISLFLYTERLKEDTEKRVAAKYTAELAKFQQANATPATFVSERDFRKLIREEFSDLNKQVRQSLPSARPVAAAEFKSEPIQGSLRIPPLEVRDSSCPITEIPAAFEVEGKSLVFEGESEARALVGTVDLFQTSPGPRRLFGTAPFLASASALTLPIPPRPKSWSLELRAGLDTDLSLHLGGTYYSTSRLGYWVSFTKPTDPFLQPTISGGLALRLGR